MDYHRYSNNYDGKRETLLMGDDLGICHMYNFTEENWHTCEYKEGTHDPNLCHMKEILEEYNQRIAEALNKNREQKKKEQQALNDKKPGMDYKDDTTKKLSTSKRPIGYTKKENGIVYMKKLIHKGYITKIKYYSELNYIISSSLDGFIHIHDIEKLDYKDGKTFNLH